VSTLLKKGVVQGGKPTKNKKAKAAGKERAGRKKRKQLSITKRKKRTTTEGGRRERVIEKRKKFWKPGRFLRKGSGVTAEWGGKKEDLTIDELKGEKNPGHHLG